MSRTRGSLTLLLLVLSALLIPRRPARAQTVDDSLPTAKPETRGIPARTFRGLEALAARNIPSIRSFLVWRRDALVYEGYFHGAGRDSVYDAMSVTKSFLSAIAGCAAARGRLPALDTRVVSLFPEYGLPRQGPGNMRDEGLAEDDSLRRLITLRHLLTMTTGIGWSDSGAIGQANAWSSDPARFYLDLPFDDEPGSTFTYSSAAAHLFGAALARTLGTDLLTFADSTLFAPAQIRVRGWSADPLGRYFGGSTMRFTARDMLRLGVLYLGKGRLGDRQIVPASWVTESTARHVAITHRWTIPGVEGYGYYWWLRSGGGHHMYCAIGYGGQVICVVPDLDLVIAGACEVDDTNRGRSEIPRMLALVDRVVAAARR
jgi:CubicO group peptidase (beta-lactamase class C family)